VTTEAKFLTLGFGEAAHRARRAFSHSDIEDNSHSLQKTSAKCLHGAVTLVRCCHGDIAPQSSSTHFDRMT
jgi:hypothetical protein